MRVLVIGATGFLGPEVVHQLVEAGQDVVIFHRGVREAALPPSVRHLHGDRRELATFLAAFRSFDPEVVVDMRRDDQNCDGRQPPSRPTPRRSQSSTSFLRVNALATRV